MRDAAAQPLLPPERRGPQRFSPLPIASVAFVTQRQGDLPKYVKDQRCMLFSAFTESMGLRPPR